MICLDGVRNLLDGLVICLDEVRTLLNGVVICLDRVRNLLDGFMACLFIGRESLIAAKNPFLQLKTASPN